MILDLQRIKAERIAKGYTPDQMASLLGFKSRTSYTKRENGDIEIGVNTMLEIAKILNYPFIKFFTNIVPESEQNKESA